MNAQSERELRRDLAAAYRLVALFGWDDHVATHLSARLPDGTFLLNPFGVLFEEITASSLMRVDMDGTVVAPKDGPLNIAGYTVHFAVLSGRPDVMSAMHVHTHDGMAVAAMKDGLLPLNQSALAIHHDLAYHDFEGIVDSADERERLQRDLGSKNLMMLRNHGTLVVGETIAAAFFRLYMLERCCTTQVRTLAAGLPLNYPAQDAIESVGRMMTPANTERLATESFWPAMLRKIEREKPGFEA
jgi:ribulose-5-phosphate 4-epimerase/fuculose-1-phosphate aldolase